MLALEIERAEVEVCDWAIDLERGNGFLDANGEASCWVYYAVVAPLPQVHNGRHLTVTAFV